MNSRQKGSVAEREVAKLIEKWWSQIEMTAKFVRTPLSGGWGTPQIRSDFRASGDLMTNSFAFPWTVEIKRREGWLMKNVLRAAKSPVWFWWAQTIRAAEETGAQPMLWFRKNSEPWYIMLPYATMTGRLQCSHSRVYTPEDGIDVVVLQADEFLKFDPVFFATKK